MPGGRAEPLAKLVAAVIGYGIDLLVRSNRLADDVMVDQTVALQAVESCVDLPEIKLRIGGQFGLKSGLQIVAV